MKNKLSGIKIVIGTVFFCYGSVTLADDLNDFIGKVKITNEGSAQRYSHVGPKEEILLQPFTEVSKETAQCLADAHKKGIPVQLGAEVEWSEDGTVKVANTGSLKCSAKITSDNAFSYYDHCKAEIFEKKTIDGT